MESIRLCHILYHLNQECAINCMIWLIKKQIEEDLYIINVCGGYIVGSSLLSLYIKERYTDCLHPYIFLKLNLEFMSYIYHL